MQQRRYSLPLAVGVLTLLMAMASGIIRAPTAPAAQTKPSIKIGVLAPLSGPLAPQGRDIVDGARLYVEAANGERSMA